MQGSETSACDERPDAAMSEDRRRFMRALGAAALAGTTGGCASLPRSGDSFDDIPRIRLTSLPTSCNKLENVTRLIGGPDLYIKRDDVMELAHGGNKTRKHRVRTRRSLEQ